VDTALLRSVARGLCYRPLDHLVGRIVEIHDLATFEEIVSVTNQSIQADFILRGATLHDGSGELPVVGDLAIKATSSSPSDRPPLRTRRRSSTARDSSSRNQFWPEADRGTRFPTSRTSRGD